MINKLFAGKITLALIAPTLTLGLTAVWAQSTTAAPKASDLNFYNTQVLPILKASCYSCHEGEGSSGQLRMSDRADILKGGSSGPGVNLAKPNESLILRALHGEGRSMPPKGRLPKSQIDVLTKWVEMGLPMPASTPKLKSAAPPVKSGPPPVNAETMKFWSFQPVKTPAVPTVKNKAWVTNPIDAFILSKLETNHFAPAPPASKTALLRRVTYDLVGLPPTTQEMNAFLTDKSPKAYEKVVDRLLASRQYGEKWARHWLDLVRYGETNSFERDSPKPFVWRYRDYIIRALNEDRPYNQFVTEQLAGDELAAPTDDSLIATGYYRLGAWDDEPSDPEQARYDELDDVVATTGQVFLGLTVNCARCHDHKIDPIPQKDYYRLLAFFQGTTRYGGSGHSPEQNSLRILGTPEQRQRAFEQETEYRQKLDTASRQIADVERAVEKDFTPVEHEEFRHRQARLAIVQKRVPRLLTPARYAQYADLMQQQAALEKSPPPAFAKALCVTEQPSIPQTCVMMRGNPHVPGDPVEPGFPSVLTPPNPIITKPAANIASSGRRLALANWIVSPNNPLTARVIVNRLWQHHFGRGIVRSTSNFGFLGDKPTHPELLDWLAGDFVAEEKEKKRKGEEENKFLTPKSYILNPDSYACGWSLKKLHKLMLMSSAYRMATVPDPKALARDPGNDLLSHFDMRRLDAEEVRDSILAVNGSLNPKMYGPSIYPTIPAEVLAGQSRPGADWENSTREEKARRSIYIHIKRSLTVPILASFDAADTDSTCPVRFSTTQPTQALGLLNSAFINEQAQMFADFVQKQAGSDTIKQVTLTLRRVLQREPTGAEVTRGSKFLQIMQQKHHYRADEALRAYCIVALNLNEFLYLD